MFFIFEKLRAVLQDWHIRGAARYIVMMRSLLGRRLTECLKSVKLFPLFSPFTFADGKIVKAWFRI